MACGDIQRGGEKLPGLPVAGLVRTDPRAGVKPARRAVDDGRRKNPPFDVDHMRIDVLGSRDWHTEIVFPEYGARGGIPGVNPVAHCGLDYHVSCLVADRKVRDVEGLGLEPRVVRDVEGQQFFDAPRRHGLGGEDRLGDIGSASGKIERSGQNVSAHVGISWVPVYIHMIEIFYA